MYLLYCSAATVLYCWPDRDSNCWVRAEFVSLTNPQPDFPNQVWPGDILITNLLFEMLNRLCWSRSRLAGRDGKKKKREGILRQGTESSGLFGCFCGSIIMMQECTSSSCFCICNNKDHLDYNISHCHSNSTICGFHGENCEKQSPHTQRLVSSHEYFSLNSCSNRERGKKKTKNPNM